MRPHQALQKFHSKLLTVFQFSQINYLYWFIINDTNSTEENHVEKISEGYFKVRSQMQILSLQSGVYTKIRVSNKLMMIKFPLLERTVPTIVIAHTFCASPDTRISYRQCLLIKVKQDLRRIYKGSTNSRIHHFLPQCVAFNHHFLPQCIAFNQTALRHLLPECIAPLTTRGCVTPSSRMQHVKVCKSGRLIVTS